ncbi:MAG: hypothetical protein PHH73_00235 [Candidatus Rickettsiella isopodorum]|nr:hypothetical protein [Candidatus Rickettsiella isopodorum]
MKSIIEKIRLMIAYKLDKNPETCWSNLSCWAMGIQSFYETFLENGHNNYKHQECRKGNKGTPYAYCNKCELSRRFYFNIER